MQLKNSWPMNAPMEQRLCARCRLPPLPVLTLLLVLWRRLLCRRLLFDFSSLLNAFVSVMFLNFYLCFFFFIYCYLFIIMFKCSKNEMFVLSIAFIDLQDFQLLCSIAECYCIMPVAIRRLCKVSIFLVVVIKNTSGFSKNWLRNFSVNLSLYFTYVLMVVVLL